MSGRSEAEGGGRAAPAPLRRDAARNRERVLDAARCLFAERGLAVGHDEIAAAADVGVGTVYRRFPTKSDLVSALFEGQVEQLVERAEAARADDDPWRGLCGFLTEVVDLQAADRGLHDLLGGADPDGAPELAGLARARLGPIVGDLLRRARERGQVRQDVTVEDIALIPIMVGAVTARARGVAPGLHRRMLALTLHGAGQPRPATPTEALPGPEIDAEQLGRLLGRP